MTLRFDYVIVGGGTAACVLVNRLIKLQIGTVAILEAGPLPLGDASIRQLFTADASVPTGTTVIKQRPNMN